MRSAIVPIAVALVASLLLAAGPWGSPVLTSSSGASSSSSASVVAATTSVPAPSVPPTTQVSLVPAQSAKVVVNPVSSGTALPWSFWGLNVESTQPFLSSDASAIGATPVSFVRFPGGALGEMLNYTSGIITNLNGSQLHAQTSVQQFVATCKLFHCQAILQLPAEIDSPSTAAYYASYVVNTLHFQPAYWEIGNSPSGWTHFGTPWKNWGTVGGGNITPIPFAKLVLTYITAIKLVDPAGKFLALGSGMGPKFYDRSWVEELALIDGAVLTGISIHSYIMGGGPPNPTWSELFANLTGEYSLINQVTADRQYIKDVCPVVCANLRIFVTEDNAAELSTYDSLLTSFAGPLYLAAETVQGLSLRVTNLDWFCYACQFPGAWTQTKGHWQMQYYLFDDVLVHLENETLVTSVTGPTTFYAEATTNSSGLSMLMVNVNTTSATLVNMTQSRFSIGTKAIEVLWKNGVGLPTEQSVTISKTMRLPTHSIMLLTVGASGVKASGISRESRAPASHAPAPVVSTASPSALLASLLSTPATPLQAPAIGGTLAAEKGRARPYPG